MRKRTTKITLAALIACLAFGIMCLGVIDPVEAAPKKHDEPVAVAGPDIFGPITTVDNEAIRVNVYNDDPVLEVEYVVQFIDLYSGSVMDEIYTGRIFPLEGTSLDFLPPFLSMPTLVIIYAEADSDGDGVYEDCPINISSVEITNHVTNEVRTVPEIR